MTVWNVSTCQPRWIKLDHALDNIGVGSFQIRLLWACGLGFAAGGMEIMLMGFLIAELHKDPAFGLDFHTLSLVVTFTGALDTISGPFWGALADRYGRRAIFMVTCFFVVCDAFVALSNSILSFAIIRSLVSFGVGGNISVDFTLLTEFLPTKGRGTYLFLLGAFWPVGSLLTAGFAYCIIPNYGWRPFIAACALPALITLFLRPCFPESPRWLALQGRHAEATDVCLRIAEANGKQPADVGLFEGTQVYIESLPTENTHSWKQVVAIFTPSHRSTTCGLLVLLLQCHVVGYFMMLVPTLIDRKSPHTKGHKDKYVSMVGAAALGLAGVGTAMLASSVLGRLIPIKLCPVLLSLATLSFAFVDGGEAIVLCVSAIGFVLEFSYGLANTYIPEVYPTEIRASGIGALKSVAKVMSLAIPASSAYVLHRFEPQGFCLLTSAFCLVSSLCSCFFLQLETHGRELADAKEGDLDAKDTEIDRAAKTRSLEDNSETELIPRSS